ncbi:MAG TPA: hypothetical protein PK299_11470 [Anaerolineales bacterium]|nr:hypothetical protein [Anaerolineales bacterium]
MLKDKLIWILSGLLFGTLFAIGYQLFTPQTFSQAHPQTALAHFPSQTPYPQATTPTSETEQILKELENFQLTAKSWFANSKSRYYHLEAYANYHLLKDIGTYPNGQIIPNEHYLNTWYEINNFGQVQSAVTLISGIDEKVLSTQTLVDGINWVDFDTGKVETQLTEAFSIIPTDIHLKDFYKFPNQIKLNYSREWLQDKTFTVVVFSSEYPQSLPQPDLSNTVVKEKVIAIEYEVFYHKDSGLPEKENCYYRLVDGTTVLVSETRGVFRAVSELPTNIVNIIQSGKSK